MDAASAPKGPLTRVAAALSGWTRWLTLAAATLAVAAVCAVGVALLLVDTDAMKHAVERQFLQSAGGVVSYESVSLNVLPRLRFEFSGITVRVPGAVSGRIAAVHVGIAWLPLFYGEVRPTMVRVERPVLEAQIARGDTADPFAAYRAALGPIADALARHAAGTSIAIERGEVAIAYGERRFVSLSELEVAAEISAEAITATASAAAELWRAARAEVRIAPGSLAASAKLQVSGLQLAQPFGVQPSGEALHVRVDAADLTLQAVTDGHNSIRGSITGSAPQADIARAGRTVGLGAVRISLDASRDSDALVFVLREFRAGDLIPEATGTLRAKADGTEPVLELQVPVLDLERAGAAALAVAGDLDAVRMAVGEVRGGTLRELTLHAAAADLVRLADLSALRAEARVDAATIAVPAAGILVKNGSGRILIAEGALEGSELVGDIGRSSFSSGALTAAFLPRASLRSLRGTFKADLTDALAISRRLLLRGHPEALAGIEALRGRASATINYDVGRKESPLVVELKGIQATGRYRGVPVPLAMSRGDLRYSGDSVSVSGLSGTAGASSVRDGAIDITLGTEAVIRAASGDATLVLDEIYPLIASLKHLRPMVVEITRAAGTAAVRLVRLSGPLSRPASLDFDITVQPQQLRLTSTALPGPLTLAAGSVSVTPRVLRLNALQATLLDARVTASGTVEGEQRASLTLEQGSSGPEAIDWARKRWTLTAETLPRAPVALSTGRVEWTGGAGGALAAQGVLAIGNSVQVEFDLAWRPDHLELRHLALRDGDSDAAIRLQWSPSAGKLRFSGHLDHRTLERALAQPPRTRARMQGNFSASINRAEPRLSTADGILKLEALDLQEPWGVALMIEQLNVVAEGRSLRLDNGVLRLAGERLELSGTAERRTERFAIDARVSAEAVDIARLLDAFSRVLPDKRAPGAKWNLPVEGRVTVAATEVVYRQQVFQSLAASVTLASDRVDVAVKDVRVCGVTAPFTAVLTPGNVEARARLTARGQALEPLLRCLTGGELAATGTYDLEAELAANGPAGAFIETTRGGFRFAARKGRIQNSKGLGRVLEVDEVAKRLDTAPQKLLAEGLEYEEIAMTGSLERARVRLDQGLIDSPRLGITVHGEVSLADGSVELQGLVAPLDRIRRVLRRVPVVARLSGTTLIVVPLGITGTVNDPQVRVLGAAAVGATLRNLMAAVLRLPIDLLDIPGARPPPFEP